MRNLVFNNAVTAIYHFWDWSWAYKSISINNCQIGIDISAGGRTGQQVGSITLYDSSITNTPTGILSARDSSSSPAAGGSIILENVILTNVPVAVRNAAGTVLAGTTGTTTIGAWGEGNAYTPGGPSTFSGSFTPTSRTASLLSGSKYYERSKPQYETLPLSSFVSMRSSGARGDGVTDDTTALQNAINSATGAGLVSFFDAGTYLVTSTLTIPPGAKLVGESYSVIMSSGNFFNNVNSPQPVVRVGATTGTYGRVEWSDMIVATRGAQAGATLIEWNLDTGGTPSGMWDVHTRIGGFAGSNLQVAQCPTSAAPSPSCMGAFMSMHVTTGASGLYMENVWLWTADHDIEDPNNTQISVFTGRGLYIESGVGTFWL
jgi:glucan 1,3-beta-glucosidase